MYKQIFTALKLVYLVTLLCYCTLALPLSAGALKKLTETGIVTGSGFGSHKFEDTTEDILAYKAAIEAIANSDEPFKRTDESSARIVSYSNDNDGLGNYDFRFFTDNQIDRSEQGVLNQVGNETIIVVSGKYEYPRRNGGTITVHYEADENGYRPKVYITFMDSLTKSAAPPELVQSLLGG